MSVEEAHVEETPYGRYITLAVRFQPGTPSMASRLNDVDGCAVGR